MNRLQAMTLIFSDHPPKDSLELDPEDWDCLRLDYDLLKDCWSRKQWFTLQYQDDRPYIELAGVKLFKAAVPQRVEDHADAPKSFVRSGS